MTNLEKYVKAFSEALEVPESDVPALKYGESDQWDSVGHMPSSPRWRTRSTSWWTWTTSST